MDALNQMKIHTESTESAANEPSIANYSSDDSSTRITHHSKDIDDSTMEVEEDFEHEYGIDAEDTYSDDCMAPTTM